ncbi:histidine kinase [Mesonia sediminis]|uniref:Histidine kinase n=1 Tax=Mesonia sediminis TaxID=1703946 RepID=A0ABW5SDF0_9FLAO
MKKTIVLITFFFSIILVQAQEPSYFSLQTLNTLPDQTFYDIIEDDEKNIWLSANKGLYKLTGKNLDYINSSQQKGKTVFSLIQSNGSIYGINLYGQLLRSQHDSLMVVADLSEKLKGKLAQLYEHQEHIYALSQAGLSSLHLPTQTLEQINLDLVLTSAQNPNTRTIYYLTNTHQLKAIKNNQLKVIPHLPIASQQNNIKNLNLFYINNKLYLFYVQNGKLIYLSYDESQQAFINKVSIEGLENLEIRHIKSIGNDIYFSTNRGLFIAQSSNSGFKLKQHLFKDFSLSKTLFDFQGNIWVTTLKNGVFIIPKNHYYQYDLKLKNREYISALAKGKGNNLFVGTNFGNIFYGNVQNGFNRLNIKNTHKVEAIFYDNLIDRLVISLKDADGFVYQLKLARREDLKNQIKSSKGLLKAFGGLVNLSFKASYFYADITKPDQRRILNDKRAKNAFFDSTNQRLYISYIDGTRVYDNNFNSEYLSYKNNTIPTSAINKYKDSILLATNQEILKVNHTQLEAFISQDQLFFKNGILDFAVDNEDGIWVLSLEGLQCYQNKEILYEKTFFNDFHGHSLNNLFYLDNHLYFKGNQKLIYLPTNVKSHYASLESPRIKSLKIDGKNQAITHEIELEPEAQLLEIQLYTPGLQLTQETNYLYNLNQEKAIWQETSSGSSNLNFSNLPSGSYQLSIKSKDQFNRTSQEELCLNLIIKPHFYEQNWFYALCILVLGFSLYGLHHWQLNRKAKKAHKEIKSLKIQNKINALSLENLRSQMNPHFIFNALNAIQEFIVSNEKKLASNYLVKFSRLIRLYLEHAQQDKISLTEEIEALKLYIALEKLRFENEIDVQIEIDSSLNLQAIQVPSIFIQPYVENAFKHGLLHVSGSKKLHIVIKKFKESFISCIIEDNGIGRDAANKLYANKTKPHTSFALKANQRRVALYNQINPYPITVKITDLGSSAVPKGTRVEILFPINN